MRFTKLAIATFAAASLLITACSDDTQDDVQDTVEDVRDDASERASDLGDDIGETANDAQARTQGEALRAALMADDGNARSVAVIEDAIDSLPGDTTFTGVEDGSGDGMDDDGQIEVEVDDARACVEISEDGEDIDVSGGAC